MTEIPPWEPEPLPLPLPLDIDAPGYFDDHDRGGSDRDDRPGTHVIVIDLA